MNTTRPTLAAITGRVDEAEREREARAQATGEAITAAAAGAVALAVDALRIRDEDRADVLSVMTRCRMRRGRAPEAWTPIEAAIAFNAIDMVRDSFGDKAPPLDAAFPKHTHDQFRESRSAIIEKSLRASEEAPAATGDEDGGG